MDLRANYKIIDILLKSDVYYYANILYLYYMSQDCNACIYGSVILYILHIFFL